MRFNVNLKWACVLMASMAGALSAAPRLGLSATTVGTINTIPGQAGPNQTVQAYNLGDGTLTLTATASASWLSATVGARTTCSQGPGGCYAITIALNTAQLAAGTYTEFITLTAPNTVDAPQDIAVTVNTTGVPSSITAFTTPIGGVRTFQSFNIYTTGTGVKGTVTTASGGGWLSFVSGTGGIVAAQSPWIVRVAAQSGQAPGTYTGTVVITGSSVASDNKTINVTYTVTNNPILQLDSTAAVRLRTTEGGDIQYSVAAINNVGSGTLALTGAASSQKWLTGTVSGNSIVIAADPAGLAAGIYNGTITPVSNAANNSSAVIPVQLLVSASGAPLISTGGIVNAASGAQEAVSGGDIVSIYGNQFAPAKTVAVSSATPLSKTLGGTQVLVNEVPVPLFFVSPGQINFQMPYSASGSAVVQVVSNGQKGNLRSIQVNSAMPRLLYFVSYIQGGYGVIVNASDYSLPLPSGTVVPGFNCHPAKPGDTLVLYGIGFGPTSPGATEGDASSSDPLQTISGASVLFGGAFIGSANAQSAFTGLTPTAVGLYQANVVIPAETPLGAAIPVTLTVNGVSSNKVVVAISATGR